MAGAVAITERGRRYIIAAALLALFLGALDALVMSTAMPTIVADLGGLHLYAWVYSAYFLARAVSLPVFGKLADLFGHRRLFLATITLFLVASAAAGLSRSMGFLIVCRVFQGIGAGGNFALVYIVLSSIAHPDRRARTLSLASSVWGVSSLIGPTVGAVIVTYLSWRWIFFINIPLGLFCLAGIGLFLKQSGSVKKEVHLDLAGATALTCTVLGFLTLFIVGGRDYAWTSWQMALLCAGTVAAGLTFYLVEKRARDPIIDFDFFNSLGFTLGNSATFLSSFTIFALFAYAPLYIQGALGKSPMQVGSAMLSLSLGWSIGSLALGRFSRNAAGKGASICGGLLMVIGSGLTLGFTRETSMAECTAVFLLIGLSMGFVTLSTMLRVQNSLAEEHLGIATSFHQFARSLGGTIGVGICGGLVTSGLIQQLDTTAIELSPDLMDQLRKSTEHLFRPEFQEALGSAREVVYSAVAAGVSAVFRVVLVSSLLCLVCCLLLPGRSRLNTQQ